MIWHIWFKDVIFDRTLIFFDLILENYNHHHALTKFQQLDFFQSRLCIEHLWQIVYKRYHCLRCCEFCLLLCWKPQKLKIGTLFLSWAPILKIHKFSSFASFLKTNFSIHRRSVSVFSRKCLIIMPCYMCKKMCNVAHTDGYLYFWFLPCQFPGLCLKLYQQYILLLLVYNRYPE